MGFGTDSLILPSLFFVFYVAKRFKEERTPNSEGYKNIIDGLLTIRLGCVIADEVVHNVAFRDAKLAIKQ